MIVGYCVGQHEGGSIDLGKLVSNPEGKSAEIDVFRVKGNEQVYAYECKGRGPNSSASLTEVTTWREKKVPVIQKWIASETRFSGHKVGFEFWCPGGFDPDALVYLSKECKLAKKYHLTWKDGPAILKYAKDIRSRSVVAALNEHYFRHPLSRQK